MKLGSAFDDSSISIDAEYVKDLVSVDEIRSLGGKISEAENTLKSKKGKGAGFLGWLDPSEMIDPDELVRIKNLSMWLRNETDCLVLIGIGGSYLGARACYETLRNQGEPYRLKYAGTSLAPDYHSGLLSSIGDCRFAINIISKSGTTTEPAIAFRLFKKELERRIGSELAGSQIVATTDKSKGTLKEMANREGWESFTIPDDVGGRFSVLTPVGLFPLAYAGIDIDALVGGATECAVACREKSFERNPSKLYAAIRHLLYKKGLSIELMAAFEPKLEQFIEWWKQLAGESEGKEGQGLFPAGAIFTRDLHSLGQWIQEGPRILFETILSIESGHSEVAVPEIAEGSPDDGLNYLAGKSLSEINIRTVDAVREAHYEGGCPNIKISIPKTDEYHVGAMIYFFEYVTALCGYLAGINPFDQPGVEVYKRNMFKTLGKPEI